MSTIVLNTGTPTESTPAPEGHDEKMIEKFEGQLSTPETKAENTDRPAWLPEKFSTPEEMAKSYAELEKKLGAPKEPVAEQKTEDTTTTDEATKEAKEVVENAGLDWDKLEAEYLETGALGEETYKKLEKAGIPKRIADNYISGLQAQAETVTNEVLGTIGGRENFDAMAQWMQKTIPTADIIAFNTSMNSRDMATMKLAMGGMYARYTSAAGNPPKLIKADASATPASGPAFRSTAELTMAMRDPRYKTDPAYRADVMARLGRSEIF